MRRALFDRAGHLRNGWWMLVFVAAVAASRPLYKPLTQALRGLGIPDLGVELVPFLLVLAVTWALSRLRGEGLAAAGFGLGRRWLGELSAGTLLGAGSLGLAVAGMAAAGGATFVLDPARSAGALAAGLWLFLCAALLEETLFRGFLFQRLVDGIGPVGAQLAFALLFSFGHWGNPGMEGATLAWASLELAVAALLLGLAYLRTRSLALPVGLHLGWNWAQGSLLGFGVSGHEQAGWLRPILQGPEWLTGGGFGPEASLCALLADLLLLVALWRWWPRREPAARGAGTTAEIGAGDRSERRLPLPGSAAV